MKKELHPGLVAVAVVVVLGLVGMFLYRAMTDKPSYPGAGAAKPLAERQGTGPVDPTSVHSGDEAVKAGFSGASPGSKPPPDFKPGE